LLPDVTARRVEGAFRRADHVGDLQVLDDDHVEPAREDGGGLLHPVLAPIALTGPQPGDGQLDPRPPVRSSLSSGEFPLQPAQPCFLRLAQAWRGQQFPGGQRHRHGDTPVHPDYLARARRGDRVWRDGERHVPTARTVPGDPVRLRFRWTRAWQAEPHPYRLGPPDLADLPGYLAYAVILADDTESLMPSRLAPGRPPVRPGEVVRHRLGEVPERLLLDVHRPGAQPVEHGAGLGELAALLGEPWRGP